MDTGARASSDRERVAALTRRSLRRFEDSHPRCAALLDRGRRSMPRGVANPWSATIYPHPPVVAAWGMGARFRCADDVEFLDMGLAILSAFAGYAPPRIVKAVRRQLRLGTQFALPGTEDARLAEALAERWQLPSWQFTLAATQANIEAIRVARAFTGRDRILIFDGKYHGMNDATLQLPGPDDTLARSDTGSELVPEYLGLGRTSGAATTVVSFNDSEAVAAVLRHREVAAVLAEPAILNSRTILPEPGFHAGLRRLTRETGTLLIVDETYTLTSAWGGLTRAWGLEPDIVVLGKSLGGGLPLGAYGMSAELGRFVEEPSGRPVPYGEAQFVGASLPEVATGGTLSANPLSMVAGRVMIEEILTPAAYARTHALGARLASGLEAAIGRVGRPWSTIHLLNRAGVWWTGTRPRNAVEQRAGEKPEISDYLRLRLLEHGIWDAGGWSHPTVSVAHRQADIDRYVEVWETAARSLPGS